jgi:hypothetical protein
VGAVSMVALAIGSRLTFRPTMRRCVLMLCTVVAGCAQPGYHYDAGSFTPAPNDPCMRKELTTPGAVSWLNGTIGRANGVPSQVESISNLASADRIQLASIGLRFSSNAGSVLCHATLAFTNHSSESGVVSMDDPGAYAPLQVEWMSDVAIAARRAETDQLRSARHLLVKPDLTTPSIQQCVGGKTALGVGEQFPGQLWAACAAEISHPAQ